MAFERLRQDAFGGRLTDFSLESLELHRREADPRLRSACLGVEGVWHALRAEREGAGLQREACVGDAEGQLALQDVEPLILLGMDMPGGSHARGHDDLDQPVLPSRVVAADLDRLQHPEQPVRLPFVRVEQVALRRSLCSYGGHLTALPAERYDRQLPPGQQLHSGLSQNDQTSSSPSPEGLRAWRLYFESGLAVTSALSAELER